jgi:TonB-dependent SusC/RagA subfamily outer membrane receptor
MIHLEECYQAGLRLPYRVGFVVFGVLAACSHQRQPTVETTPVPASADSTEGRNTYGATQALEAKDLKAERAQSVEELIQGRFAGVQVIRLPGGGFSLRIRGAGSLMSSSEPLYIVDGIALPPAPGGALVGVDPRDIERIDVLKDVSTTSSYGVRGANGVILIKTKRGR